MLPAVLENQVVADRTPVPDDTDRLTKTTVQKMGEYIRSSAADPLVQNCARYASGPMSRIFPHPAFGVFFFLKHRVRRVLDEGNMFRVGEPGAYDMLISPAVLLRMPNPAEDCDGFTMAAAAMLEALGIPNCIVTVGCDPREPQRWSHVFGMVQLPNGEWMPLDCSHGTQPGWMVPPSRISRWQAWDLNGNPIDVAQPTRSYLRGYVPLRRRRRGVGQCDYDDSGNLLGCAVGTPVTPVSVTPAPTSYIGGCAGSCPSGQFMDQSSCTCVGAISSSPTISTLPNGTTIGPNGQVTSPATINWGSLISSVLGDATKVASIAELPAGSSLTASGAVTSAISSLLPLLLLAAGAFVVIELVSSAGKR